MASSPTHRRRALFPSLGAALLGALSACGTSGGATTPSAGGSGGQVLEAGAAVNVAVTSQALTLIDTELDAVEDWTTEDLLAADPTAFEADLGFSPKSALNYDLIQGSALALNAANEAQFEENGFVIVSDPTFPTFSYAYQSIYSEDLPVYVSADSVLDAVHRSYDDILKGFEQDLLMPTLAAYLDGMQAALASATLDEEVRNDTQFFLSVAQELLENDGVDSPEWDGQPVAAATPGDPVSEFVAVVLNDKPEIREIELFGAVRLFDLSQFKPRGHYTESLELRRYFRAMIWLGRTDLRLIETLGTGETVFRRRQTELAATLRSLMTDETLAQWKTIDDVITKFVGEHDYMTVLEMDALLSDLDVNVADVSTGLDEHSDDEIAQAIIDGQYGEQRIASQAIVKQDVFSDTLPLSASFALFGQRYAVDSHVFSQVVYDRAERRVVPDPLDAAFAALGNDQAATLLVPQLDEDAYAPNLGAARALVDQHPQSYWESSLYTRWLSGLRTLSAHSGPAGASDAAPIVTRTEGWGRRLLNTQLGSWAQLRHDTILYVKQSYTTGTECEYPDAYVEPYPEFWHAMQAFGETGATLVATLPAGPTATAAGEYFRRFAEIVGRFAAMSENQLSGEPHSAEQLAFVNNAVRISGGGSGPPTIEGWYHQLLFDSYSFSEQDNVIADVHTDIGGDLPKARPASVLHVGTADPRIMVVAVETCEGPRAYAGPVFNFKQHLVDGLERMTDDEWQEMLNMAEPPDPTWMAPVVGTRPAL